MRLIAILSVPLILSILALLPIRSKWMMHLTWMGYLLGLLLDLSLIYQFISRGTPINLFNLIYADALSVFFVLIISIVSFAGALYSQGFMAQELKRGMLTDRKLRIYYLLYNLFVFSMLMVTVVNNLGLMWVAIEITTLVSTFLVGFYNTKHSVEAAWKYIIICSVGIILALIGTILFSYALLLSSGTRSLNWTEMMANAALMDKNLIKIAFVFIVVGYGTKAGLAPMHTWLPDAHSQAVSPVSALLSGLLLKTAFFSIIRFAMIAAKSVGPQYVSHILLPIGLISLAVAAGLILVQKDIKRLLAYSSIEHIGLIAFGFGVGGEVGIYGVLLHIFNHAMTKSLLFFGAGNIVSAYGKHKINQVRGVISVLPFTGILFLLGTFAISGLPPFSLFRSEMLILLAAFMKRSILPASLALLFIIVVFAAMIYHFAEMLFGKKPTDLPEAKEPPATLFAMFLVFIVICIMGFVVPGPINKLILMSVDIIKGI